jgi:DNA mismatch repair protein MSH3
MAVASAVLQHLLQVTKCKTLFITHYPLVAIDLEKQFPADLQNLHMGYTEDLRIDGTRDITFLYRLTRGIAKESFGIECARLAGLPEQILSVATDRSATMQSIAEQRSRRNKYVTAIQPLLSSSFQRIVDTELENA